MKRTRGHRRPADRRSRREPAAPGGMGPSLTNALGIGIALGILFAVLVIPLRQPVEIIDEAGANVPLPSATGRDPAARSPAEDGTDGLAAPGNTAGPTVRDPGGSSGTSSPVDPGNPTTPGPNPTGGQPPTQGVSSDKIRIGVALPDLGIVANLGPNYDIGDPEEQFESILAAWHESGRLPVHGRDVEFVYRYFDILDASQQRSACVGFATDDLVFAVIGSSNYYAGAECVTQEHHLPLITSNGHTTDRAVASAPLLFDLVSNMDLLLANFAHWAHAEGILQGKRIGVYYGSTAEGVPVVNGFLPALKSLGYEVTETVTTDNPLTGSPAESVAVQRFQAARVDLAILFVTAINQTNFMQQAEARLYKPTYINSDLLGSTLDTSAATFPPSQYDGSYAMTTFRLGQEAGGMGLQPQARTCLDNYEAYSGKKVTSTSAPAEWYTLLLECDESEAVIRALERAGPTVTVDSFVAAMNGLGTVPMGIHTDVRFSLNGGTHNVRTLQWKGSCTCYVATGPIRTFFVDSL